MSAFLARRCMVRLPAAEELYGGCGRRGADDVLSPGTACSAAAGSRGRRRLCAIALRLQVLLASLIIPLLSAGSP